jgi:hypothetical protein
MYGLECAAADTTGMLVFTVCRVVLFAFLLFFFTPLFWLVSRERQDSSMGSLRPTKWLSPFIICTCWFSRLLLWHQNSVLFQGEL